MSKANDLEILMLGLINAERAAAGIAPLIFDDNLNDASEDHSTWMLDADVFSHTGVGGSNPTQRMESSGFQFEGTWSSGENIGFQSERGDPGLEDDVEAIHQNLMNSPGHRANILDPGFEEIGIGIERGDFLSSGRVFDSVMITQNFASTDAVDLEVPVPSAPGGEVNQPDLVGEMTIEDPEDEEESDEETVDEEETVDASDSDDSDDIAEDNTDDPVGNDDDMLVAFGCGQNDDFAGDFDFSISFEGDVIFQDTGRLNFQFVFNIDLPDDDEMSDMVELEVEQIDGPFRGSIAVEFDTGNFGDFFSDFTTCQPDCMELA